MSGMAKPYKRKGSRFWWIAPVISGRQAPQSTKTEDYTEAREQLNSLEGKAADGIPISARPNRVLFRTLAEGVETDYANKKLASLPDLRCRLDNHINPLIGHLLAHRISSATLSEYTQIRQKEGAANATINREMAAIKRAYTLGMRSGQVLVRPFIEKLPEDNEREGLFGPDQFQALLAKANTLTADLITLAYYSGWRKTSLTEIEWSQVDFRTGVIYGIQKKNKKRVGFPFAEFPDVKAMLVRRREETEALQREAGRIIPYVFHRKGKQVKSWRGSWEKARRESGLAGKVLHDFRRTAVTNMLDAGIPIDVIMDIAGFKTVQMILRYAQTREQRLREAGAMLRQRLQATATQHD